MKKIILTLVFTVFTLLQVNAQTLTYCEGETVELTSQNTGDSYEWKKVGAPAVLATTKDYIVSNAITTAENGDQYTLTITKNSCVSDVATITLDINAKPIFTKVEAGADICGTGKAAYTITGTAGADVTYQIGSEAQTTATIGTGGTVTVSSINNVTANTTITISNITKNSCPVAVTTNNTATVNVNTPPAVPTLTVDNATVCGEGTVTFTIEGAPGAVVTYSSDWLVTGTRTLDATTGKATITANLKTTGFNPDSDETIKLKKIELNGCSTPLTIELKAEAITKPEFTSVTASADICETGKATYKITGTAGAVVTYQIGSEAQTTATIGTSGTVTVSSINNVTANTTITVTKIEKDTCPVNITASNTATVNVNAKPIAIIKKK